MPRHVADAARMKMIHKLSCNSGHWYRRRVSRYMASVAITMAGDWGEEACTPRGGPLLSILKGENDTRRSRPSPVGRRSAGCVRRSDAERVVESPGLKRQ